MSSNCIFSQFLEQCKGNFVTHSSRKKKVLVLGTGGTIAGVAADPGDNVRYVAGTVAVESLLSRLAPRIPSELILLSEQISQIDSKDMDFSIWATLARRVALALSDPDISGLVITHGTDTLEETAFFLHLVCHATKPVVLTCAMRPDSSAQRDGPQNLADALAVAVSEEAQGVVAVCAGRVHSAEHVQKVHTYRLDPFDSGEAGLVALVEEGVVRSICQWPIAVCKLDPLTLPEDSAWPRVEVISNQVQADGWLPRVLLAAGGLDGLVVAGTGNGSLSQPLKQALMDCQSAGVEIRRVTRCQGGPLLNLPHESFPAESGLSAAKARVKLILELLAKRRLSHP